SGASAAQPERFSSPADAGWKTADEVLRSTPDGFTAAGLPKRKPRARLVPGSASAPDSLLNQAPSTSAASTSPTTPATSAAEPATPRDAEQTRSRMSSFQRGLRDGRAQVVRDDSGTVSTQAQSTQAQSNQAQTDRTQTNRTQTSRALPDDRASDRPASIGRDNVASESDPTTRIDAGIIAASGLPKRTPRAHTNGTAPSTRAAASTSQPEPTSSPTEASTSRMPAPATSPTAAPSVSREPGELHWGTVADDGWQTADQVHRQEPEGFTAAGLPKRTPRARLVPGSVASGTRRVTSGAGGSSGQGESTSAQFGSTRTAVADQPAGFSRDANAVRSRLSSFQRGLREGRHTVRTPAGDRAMDGNH
ncbi:MAG: hypothetical protein J2O49_09195, partial [Sciscionella sp.]|nr:hypothetical protein [Sciscionella sp.]